MQMSFIISRNVNDFLDKTPRELTEKVYKFNESVVSSHVYDQFHVFFFFAHCIVFKVRFETNC